MCTGNPVDCCANGEVTLSNKRQRPEPEHAKENGSLKMFRKGQYMLPGRKGEDRIVAGMEVLRIGENVIQLFAVIDGHGGESVAVFLKHRLPFVIATLCKERAELLDANFCNAEAWSALLRDAFQVCNDTWDKTAITPAEVRSGAVLTMVLVGASSCLLAHVGDGKAVALRGAEYIDLTPLHRCDVENERKRVEENGGCVFNNRVRGILSPTRAFGDIFVRTDKLGHINDKIISPTPAISRINCMDDGCIVLGTDGLFDVFSGDGIVKATRSFLLHIPDETSAAVYLSEQAAKITDDDISVIVISWKSSLGV